METTGGNEPYTYAWSNGRTTSTNSNLSFGSYTVTITDRNDCILVSDPIDLRPVNDTIVLENVNIQQADCTSNIHASIETTFSGGVGNLSYQWDNGAMTPNIYDLEPGSYNLVVTDDINCEFFLLDVVIEDTQNSPIELTSNFTNTSCNGICDGVVSTSVSGGAPPYSYSCLLYTSPSPRDQRGSRMPSSA